MRDDPSMWVSGLVSLVWWKYALVYAHTRPSALWLYV
jgi:hypothetical protein